jgi:hypothetical protein
LYESTADLAQRFPFRLGKSGVRVLKQGRGNGGNGVWKVTLLEPNRRPGDDAAIRIQHAQTKDAATEDTTLGEFIEGSVALSWTWPRGPSPVPFPVQMVRASSVNAAATRRWTRASIPSS